MRGWTCAVASRLEQAGQLVRMAARGLMDPGEMVERRGQAIDLAVSGSNRVADRKLSDAALRLSDLGSRLRPPNGVLPKSVHSSEISLRDVFPRSLIIS